MAGAAAAEESPAEIEQIAPRDWDFGEEADWKIGDGTRREVKKIMWDKVGIVRNEQGLKEALDALEEIGSRQMNTRSWNFVILAKLVAQAALGRRESRGGHYRSDYPEHDDINFLHHTLQQRVELQQQSSSTKLNT